MRVVSEFPHKVKVIENLFIPLADGCRLAAKIWMPEDAERHPVPAILEYLPYRKRDRQALRDSQMHGYFAGHGYACVRLDLRGSGDSDGAMFDEYLPQELSDGAEAIAWIAKQPWCSGSVGMMGISWGGFNSLQVAALRPPALKAIISLCASDDRYADDMHYMGGCVLMDLLGWGSTFLAYFGTPPDPLLVGDRWRDMWLERIENATVPTITWLQHQQRDEFWKQSSVCEDYSQIACPVYAVGGWADGYTNSIPRLLSHLKVPRKGLIGPWGHTYPNLGGPGPAIGFLQEALRWWDQWLRGKETGIMKEPMLRAWMLESEPARNYYAVRAGRWAAEEAWPSPRIRPRRLAVNAAGLADKSTSAQPVKTKSPQTVGLASADWCPYGIGHDMPGDQRIDDGRSLTFDTEPLADRLEFLGAAELSCDVAVDRPTAFIVARLCDVAPTGESVLITYGVLNLTHRNGHEKSEPLEPGRRYSIKLMLNHVGYCIARGHRLRLALSTAYWPVVWPSPEPVTLTVFAGGDSALTLPVRPPRAEDASLAPFKEPEQGPSVTHSVLRMPRRGRMTVTQDAQTGEFRIHSARDRAAYRLHDIKLDHSSSGEEIHTIHPDDPLAARSEAFRSVSYTRDSWHIRVDTHTILTATRDHFVVTADLDAFEGATRVVTRRWNVQIPRRGV